MREINQAGLELVKSFEGLRLDAYQDSVGVWTIGYGSTTGVRAGQVITEADAEALLRADLGTAEAGVEDAIGDEATDNQFAACVSLAFNVGVGLFAKSSIVRLMLAGEPEKAAERFLLYNRAGGKVLAGLTRRRAAERALFLTPDESDPAEIPVITDPAAIEPPPVATSTTTTEQSSSIISTVVNNAQVKEIASTGLSTIGTRLATGGISSGALSAIAAFTAKAWPLLIFAAVLIILGVAVWMLVYHHKESQKVIEAQIAADPARSDIHFAEAK